jgi:hypothetical protein
MKSLFPTRKRDHWRLPPQAVIRTPKKLSRSAVHRLFADGGNEKFHPNTTMSISWHRQSKLGVHPFLSPYAPIVTCADPGHHSWLHSSVAGIFELLWS